MPVSEDEFERPVQIGTNQSAMSKAEQRKSNKPIMEKRRRARINHCLNELKTLILDAMKKDPARHSKLEKADILEMTVKHLQQIQRQQLATAVATDPSVIMRFKSGFDECAAEVSRYINRLEGVDNGVKQRLTAHLHRCVSSLQQIYAFPHQNMFSALTQNCDKSTLVIPNVSSIPGDVNNNSNQNGERIQIPSGLHLIPSRLPTGELALLVPNSSHISSFLNAPTGATFQFPPNPTVNIGSVLSPTLGGALNSNSNHASAFTAVSKTQDYPSPTSTADFIKKEPNLLEKEEYKPGAYLSRTGLNEQVYPQTYNMKNHKVTDGHDGGEKLNEEADYKKVNLIQTGHDLSDSTQKYGKFKTFMHTSSESVGYDQKVTQRASSSSFQRTVADSTTSFIQANESETSERGFKPFQVEIPNSHLKAHISISENFDETKGNPLQIHQKPNPNFTLNPNKFHSKSPHRFVRNYPSPENNYSELETQCEMGFEKFSKIEPLSIVTKMENIQDGNDVTSFPPKISLPLMRPTSSETFQTVEAMTNGQIPDNSTHRGVKRPLSNGSTDMSSPSSSESPMKTPRISLNVTLTEGQSKDESNLGNRCKRISVIVEDSSKSSAGRENNGEMAANVSSQKDMWRPW